MDTIVDTVLDNKNDANITAIFHKGVPLLPEELLIYASLKLKGYPQIEVILSKETHFKWEIYVEGKQRQVDLNWCDIPQNQLFYLDDLVKLLQTLQELKSCPGIDYEKYAELFAENKDDVAFRTTKREPAAFIETLPSQFHKKIIRSQQCAIFLPKNDLVCVKLCDNCKRSGHYMRTMRSCTEDKENKARSKFYRLDRLKHDELLRVARESSRKLKNMQNRIRKFENLTKTMTHVGANTHQDLSQMFKGLQEGLERKRKCYQSPACKWGQCKETFDSCEELYEHARSHVGIDDGIAPSFRNYQCQWPSCGKEFKKKRLIEKHLVQHTGDARTHFLEILLKDQAKALNTDARQMRWHPLIIRWCLRLYNRSHASYNALQDSGFLKLPTGRALSDYRNFNKPDSGWKLSQMDEMKKRIQEKKLPESAYLGGIFFDEVKVKEGLVFDASNWELVGFTDLSSDEKDLDSLVSGIVGHDNANGVDEGDCKPKEGLATHVLQFFYKSLFSNFEFPCAYFQTRGIKAGRLNKLFWEGVSLFRRNGFKVLVVCCDGAPQNRAFIKMNTNDGDSMSPGFNLFSQQPMFFMTDPPHLIKKLRNNLSKSGYGKGFSRLLKNEGKWIVWKHVEEVQKREQTRRARYTKLTSSHINLDSLTKMRVKLAVETLAIEVADDMFQYDYEKTAETQRYVRASCEMFGVFNSKEPLCDSEDTRMVVLEGGLNYFQSWKESLQHLDKKTKSASFISWETFFDLQVSIPSLKIRSSYFKKGNYCNTVQAQSLLITH
eukprot:Seg1542.3 transcript_id=Seg1542.3/GoldUCD/mRNA.D3Y31 product="Transposable element P transposase" protein_id=Seg1542.3/GoldUCD/D3Y31